MSWNLQLTKFVINCTRGRSHNATKTAFYLHIPSNRVKRYNKTRLKKDSNSLLKHSSYVKNILFLFLEPFESLILKFCTKECSSLKSFWRLKFPPFSKKTKIFKHSKVAALANENNHLNNLFPYAMLCMLPNFWNWQA